MESQIHQLEQEAYGSVLRAFKAQSDAITWEKEGLITELRKELRVSDNEHRELLTSVNADDIICRIREWRKAGENNTIFTVPQPFAAAAEWTPSSCVRREIARPVQQVIDPLIGKKVMTRWPKDNNFREAVITDYSAQEGLHALVYDINTPRESWEWVDLREVAEYIRWVDEDPGLSHRSRLDKQGSGVKNCVGPSTFSNSGRGDMMDQFEKEFPPSANVLKASEVIEILHTDTLIMEVQKVFTAHIPDPLQIIRAKKVLKDHEQALMDVISKVAAVLDSECDKQKQSPHVQTTDGEQRWRNDIYSGNSSGRLHEVETM